MTKEEKIIEIQRLLLLNNNIKKVSEILNIPGSTIRLWVKQHNLIVKKTYQRLNINHNYFDDINTPVKAYILGYLFADGSIEHRNKVKRIRFNSAMSDFEILSLIKNEISPETKISITSDKRTNLTIKGANIKTKQDCASFGIVSPKIVDTLTNKFNISYDKTYSQNEFNFNEIPENFHRDFIRGFFDGDGSIHGKVDFVSMNHVILNQISNILTEAGIETSFKVIQKSNNIGYLLIKNSSKENFKNFIYYKDCICLQRKKNKFIWN